jgi:uncharacterized protein (TIGR02246 family)
MRSIRSRFRLFACAVVVPFALACAPDRDDPDAMPGETPPPAAAEAELPPELASAGDRYVEAWNGTDAAAVAAFFTENAMATVNGEMYHGRQEILEGWIEPNVGNLSNLEITETATRREGDDFYGEGTWTATVVTPEGETDQASGRYSGTWTHDADGQWRIRSTNVETDEPAAA